MTKDDFRRFAQSLSAVADLYGKTLSEGAMALWWQCLERYELSEVEVALRKAIENPDSGQFMPKPADVIRAIEGTAEDRSFLAWGKVLDAMQSVGAYSSIDFGDNAIHAAINDMGGWPALCRSEITALPFTQKRFCDLYATYSSRPTGNQRLIGVHESSNALRGHQISSLVRVGELKAIT